jgi:hypothetical protein
MLINTPRDTTMTATVDEVLLFISHLLFVVLSVLLFILMSSRFVG